MSVLDLIIQQGKKLQDAMHDPAAAAMVYEGCRTLIRSDTGTGKTTWVLKELSKHHRILMLVPLVSQIKQLLAEYGGNGGQIIFLSGSSSSHFEETRDLRSAQVIVATYDYLRNLFQRKDMDWKQYLLVVDEVHKTYSAGSYRDSALNPVLYMLSITLSSYQKGTAKFKGCIMLTATWSEHMARYAKIVPEQRINTKNLNNLHRTLTIRNRPQEGKWHWIEDVACLADTGIKGDLKPGIVLVRLNSNKQMLLAKAAFEKMEFKVMMISRKYMNVEEVRESIEAQCLNTDYNIILTTSILDEAINLNNKEGQINSVHLVGRWAHPEEIVQFAGRLRKATPPIYLHLQQSDWPEAEPKDKPAYTLLDAHHNRMTNIATNMRNVLNSVPEGNDSQDMKSKVTQINATFERTMDCHLLALSSTKKPWVNSAGILAAIYRKDTYLCSRSFNGFKSRIEALTPFITVNYVVNNDEADRDVSRFMGAKGEEFSAQLALISSEIVKKLVDEYEQTKHVALHEYASECIKRLEDQDRSYRIPYDYIRDEMLYDGYRKALNLAAHVVKTDEIVEILSTKKYRDVIRFVTALDDHLIINVRKELEKLLHMSAPVEIRGPQARDIAIRAAQATTAKYPDFKEAVRYGRRIEVEVKKNNQFDAEHSRALNLIASCSESEDKNSHKPDKRYLRLKGLSYQGYRYQRLEPLRKDELRVIPEPPRKSLEDEFDD